MQHIKIEYSHSPASWDPTTPTPSPGCIWTAPVADDGTITGPWLELGEAHPLSIQLQDEDPTTIKGRTCKTRGLVIGSKPNPGSATGSLTLHEYTTANVAKALKGLVSVNAGAGSALTNQEVHLKGLGEYVEVGSELLSSVTVTDAGGTELHEGVDYSINLTLGMIAAQADAVANTTVKISATVAEDKAGRVLSPERCYFLTPKILGRACSYLL